MKLLLLLPLLLTSCISLNIVTPLPYSETTGIEGSISVSIPLGGKQPIVTRSNHPSNN